MFLSVFQLPALDERIPMPGFFIPSFYLVLIGSILIRSYALRRVIVTVVTLAYLWGFLYMTGGIDSDCQNMTMLITSTLMWIDFGATKNFEKDLFRTWEQDVPVSHRSFFKKLAWSYDLWTTWRGPGWNWESKRSPRQSEHLLDQRNFLIDNVKRGAYCWCMSQILLCLLEKTPFTRIIERQHIQNSPLHIQIAVIWIATLYTQYNMSFMYRLVTSLLVFLGICAPFQCPPLFGSFSQMYTVGNLWSVCWQQMMRKAILVIPNHVVSIVGMHDLVARYTRLVLSFAVSGAIHSVGAYSATRGTFGDMRMFLSQACAIIVEDCVITLGKQVGIKKSRSKIAIGFIWTIAWFSFCLRPWIGEMLWAGMLATNGNRSMVSKLFGHFY